MKVQRETCTICFGKMEQMGWAKDGCQNKYVKNSLLTN